MDNFGTEIGQKMRSAVKAKLLELGTGGSSGYIDDELPDYVMIMVANKRSKQQMIADLNLFLGSQTELFVTWLHEVLQKLQEVTLPAAAGAAAAAKKRKSGQKDETATANKKDKRSAKKEKSNKSNTSKKPLAEAADQPSTATSAADGDNRPSTTTGTIPVINSITDVFAEQLLEKAKKSMDVASESAANIKKGKGKKGTAEEQEARDEAEETNEFDIPTISEISSTTDGGSGSAAAATGGNREKDLAELADIQKKIYAAKRHLKQLGELNEDAAGGGGGESDDEDFLNLKDDGSADEFNDAGDLVKKPHKTPPAAKAKSPIVFDERDDSNKEQSTASVAGTDPDSNAYLSTKRRRLTPPPIASVALKTANEASDRRDERQHPESEDTAHASSASSSRRSRERERREPPNPAAARKRPVHERLGMKPPPQRESQQQQSQQQRDPPPRERRVRQEKELYVPAFRRKEQDSGGGGRTETRSEREVESEQRRERENERKGRSSRERERGSDRDRSRRRAITPEQPTSSSVPASTISAVERHGGGKQEEKKNHHNPFSSGSRRSDSPFKQQKRSSSAAAASSPSPPQVQRIGSRVIVAPAKPAIESSDDDDINQKPVNSVIKIKPRTPVSPSKQACKNLLLRAVAEAQRSTIAAKSKKISASSVAKEPKKLLSARLGAAVEITVGDERNPKLYTKSYRERLKCGAASSACSTLFRRTTQNLVIEVESGSKRGSLRKRKSINEEEEVDEPEPEEYAEEEYVPAPVGRAALVDEYQVQVQQDSADENSADVDGENFVDAEYEDEDTEEGDEMAEKIARVKTQFVVTLNDDKSPPPPSKYKPRSGPGGSKKRSRSASPLPQVSSTSSKSKSRHNGGNGAGGAEPSSTTHNHHRTTTTSGSGGSGSGGGGSRRKHDIKSRLSAKASSSLSPSTHTTRVSERESSNSSPSSNTPPQPRRSELIEIYRKPKDIKKIIIKNDSEDDEMSPKKASAAESHQRKSKRRTGGADTEERSTTPPLPASTSSSATKKRAATGSSEEKRKAVAHSSPTRSSPTLNLKRKRMPIKFDLDQRGKERARSSDAPSPTKRRSKSGECERDSSLDRGRHGEERRKITIRAGEAHKYENIPSLSSVAFDSAVIKVNKPKERCKYHPNCTKQFCEFYHPTAPCKSFPNCKFADKCMYSHPHCKFDMACGNLDCNYAHSGQRNLSLLQPTAPPLSSHVVPVQNYKSISVAPAASSAMCKYYPTCTKVGCTFYHPKQCRFGNNCINKLECSFYHHDIQSSSKFKWVASLV